MSDYPVEDYFVNEVTHQAQTGQADRHGQPGLATGLLRPCRFRFRQQKIRGADGGEVLSNAQIHFAPTVTVKVGDVVTYYGQAFEVLAVENSQSFNLEFIRAHLGSIRARNGGG
jgi:hypothetical protein